MTKRVTFKLVYLIYLAVLAIAVAAAVLYVRSLLNEYEASQPEEQVRAAVAALAQDAAAGDFWTAYDLPAPAPGRFESHLDVRSAYLAQFTSEGLEVAQASSGEDELYYTVERSGVPLAEVKLTAAGPAVTKLAVFTIRHWDVAYVKPILEATDYTLTVPTGFTVTANGIPLTAADGAENGAGETVYTLPGLYLEPALEIADWQGSPAGYSFRGDEILVEYYNYSLTLPAQLAVTVDGAPYSGEALSDGRVRYEILRLDKPLVEIADQYGNTVTYEGGSGLPLTYMTLLADSDCTVTVSGKSVPQSAAVLADNPDYAPFSDYVENLPQQCAYQIAILERSAAVTAAGPDGETLELIQEGPSTYSVAAPGSGQVPDEVAAQVDVLRTAQDWSLFMSNDLRFSSISPSLIAGSYQYNVAYSYATGIDITFTSSHILLDPAFTDISVANFQWITDRCFSVDISFVKHMQLTRTGEQVDDHMNDRFYFVWYDDTNNGVDDPAWKLASMKEIVDDETE